MTLPGGQAPLPRAERDPMLDTDAVRATDFYAAARANRANTWILILILLLVAGTLGYLIGLFFDPAMMAEDGAAFDLFTLSETGALVALALMGFGAVWTGVTFAVGDRIVLRLGGAKEVTPEAEPMLHNVVEEMAIAAGMPKPRVAVIETDTLNAFATGMRPEKAAIAVTRGLMNTLERSELQAVVAHEMGHIANWDIRYMTAVGVMVGLIALVSDGVLRTMRFGGARGASRGSGRSGKGGGGGAILVLVVLVVFAVLAPLAARLVQMAVSRQREYLADATSVRLTRDPSAMIRALRKLAGDTTPFTRSNRAVRHLYIVDPDARQDRPADAQVEIPRAVPAVDRDGHALSAQPRGFMANMEALWSTHPPITERIRRLQNLGA